MATSVREVSRRRLEWPVWVVLEIGAKKREDAGKCKLSRICKKRSRSILCMLYKSVTCDFFTWSSWIVIFIMHKLFARWSDYRCWTYFAARRGMKSGVHVLNLPWPCLIRIKLVKFISVLYTSGIFHAVTSHFKYPFSLRTIAYYCNT